MTQRQLSILLGYNNIVTVNNAFREASKHIDSIKAKSQQNTHTSSIDYSLEECIAALSYISFWNPMLTRYVKEHFISEDSDIDRFHYVKLDNSAKRFIYRRDYRKIDHVCCNCEHLVARSFNQAYSRLYPYCSWYRVFLNKYKPKIDIHKERCPTYLMSERPPLILTSDGLYPITLLGKNDNGYYIKHDNTTTLGIPNDRFKTKHKKGTPIVILRDMFTEEDQ